MLRLQWQAHVAGTLEFVGSGALLSATIPLNSRSTHAQLTLNSRSTRAQLTLTLNSRSIHAQRTLNSSSTHAQLTLNQRELSASWPRCHATGETVHRLHSNRIQGFDIRTRALFKLHWKMGSIPFVPHWKLARIPSCMSTASSLIRICFICVLTTNACGIRTRIRALVTQR